MGHGCGGSSGCRWVLASRGCRCVPPPETTRDRAISCPGKWTCGGDSQWAQGRRRFLALRSARDMRRFFLRRPRRNGPSAEAGCAFDDWGRDSASAGPGRMAIPLGNAVGVAQACSGGCGSLPSLIEGLLSGPGDGQWSPRAPGSALVALGASVVQKRSGGVSVVTAVFTAVVRGIDRHGSPPPGAARCGVFLWPRPLLAAPLLSP